MSLFQLVELNNFKMFWKKPFYPPSPSFFQEENWNSVWWKIHISGYGVSREVLTTQLIVTSASSEMCAVSETGPLPIVLLLSSCNYTVLQSCFSPWVANTEIFTASESSAMCLVLCVDLMMREGRPINRLVLRFYKFFTKAFTFRVQVL